MRFRPDLKTRADLQQDIWEANAQGKVFDAACGELRAADRCHVSQDTL